MTNRMPHARRAALAILVVGSLAGRRGRADEPARPPMGLRLDLSIGLAVLDTLTAPRGTLSDNIGSGAVALGCALDGRVGPVVFGANADAAETFNQNERFLGVHAGYVRDLTHEELAIVPEAGVHLVTDLGRGFLTESDSRSATLPYAGLKLGVLHRNGRGRPDGGLWFFIRGDLSRRTVVAHTSVFTDHRDIAYDVGGVMFGVSGRAQLGR